MARKTYDQLANEAAARIDEVMPWDVPELLDAQPDALLLDIRERDEYATAHVAGSLNVPRGILESAAEWGFPETEPELVTARDRPVIILCRSGKRSAFAAETLKALGFTKVFSVKLGIKGWNDADQDLHDAGGTLLDGDDAMEIIDPPLRPDQIDPTQR